MTDNFNELFDNYQKACNGLLDAFCKRHDYENDGWIDKLCSAAYIGEIPVDMQTIVTDLEEKPSTDKLMEWIDYDMTCADFGVKSVNFYSWIHGCPRYTKEDFDRLTELRNRVDVAKEELEKAIEEFNDNKYIGRMEDY